MDDIQGNKNAGNENQPESINGPHAVPVVVTRDDHTFELDEEALASVLLDERVRDKKIVIISVAGAFRKGKSFLLDFLLRYMERGSPSNDSADSDWLGDCDSPLEGFHWRGGADRDTTGMLLWSEPFIVDLPDKTQVAVLFMDTQGSFDSQSTVKDCATVFALSTMLSSVQVFNLSSNIQEDDLQHLQLFTEYGRLALADSCSKPFQVLHFLVRDWCYPYQHPYGEKGGEEFLQKRLKVTENQHEELQQLRKHLRSCFDQLHAYLMPHPGLKVSTNPDFDGRLSEIEPDFIDHLKTFVPLLLSPQNLVVKEINGTQITGRMLIEYFKSYLAIYQGDDLPEPKSMLRATAEANNLAALSSAKDFYIKEMESLMGGDLPYVNAEVFCRQQTHCFSEAMSKFNQTRKMGSEDFCKEYLERLELDLKDLGDSYEKHNEAKNIFAAARTPAILMGIAAVFYVSGGLLGFVGIESIAALFTLFLYIVVGVVTVWAYSRYTGKHRDISLVIDTVAALAYEQVIDPVCSHVTKGTVIPGQVISQNPSKKKI